MNTFVKAVQNQEARTENGMKARASSANACTDLFFNIGASRGADIVPGFEAAYVENRDYALRIAAWARDVRGGAGERETFRNILRHLNKTNPNDALALARKVPELGRWDDILVLAEEDSPNRKAVFNIIHSALICGNGLCAKWMPRKGKFAVALRKHFGWTPKTYRKRLVELTSVVETKMCANDWDSIDFSHVPSVAAARYRNAFYRHAEASYKAYVESLVKGDDSNVKVNAGAIFPHDVIIDLVPLAGAIKYDLTTTELDFITKQWESLPNYVGDSNILPMVDVSGSMSGKNVSGSVNALHVALSLGLYLADKNTGPYKDTFLTFSIEPELVTLSGNIVSKIVQMNDSHWDMNTNLHAAFDKILKVAVDGRATQEDMPKVVLILSDMQFDSCVRYDDSAIEMIRRKYNSCGYDVPKVVFWNISKGGNIPVRFDENGVALVSGFSPAILKSVLAADFENFTPEAIMLQTINNGRYSVNVQ